MIKFQIILFVFLAATVFAADRPGRLLIPFLDPASQSNVIVTVSASYGNEKPCPVEYTNSLSNTNLFTPEEQKQIGEVLGKLKNVTTNSGPGGTVLINFYKTNSITSPPYWIKTNLYSLFRRTNEILVSCFQYTNLETQEEIRFGAGISAKVTDNSQNGYLASITRTGGGALLTFTELKQGLASGVMVRFDDFHTQGTSWDYRLADFTDGHLCEYMQITNGMVLGKWLMWNAKNGGLTLEAEAKQPYDWNSHRVSLP